MRKVLFTLLAIVICGQLNAQKSVKYSNKLFSDESCKVEMSVSKDDSVFFLLVSITSEKLQFDNSPTLMFRTEEEEVVKLFGNAITAQSNSAIIPISGMYFPVSEITSMAQFRMSKSEVECLKHGIKKIRINTVPIVHEKEFKKDKIGRTLYLMFNQIEDF